MTTSVSRIAGRQAVAIAALAIALLCIGMPPAAAQWDDSYDAPRQRSGDYYREDSGSGARQGNRRYVRPQEPQRQFFWPWEDRTQQAQPAPAAPRARPVRPRSPSYADEQRLRRPRPAPAAVAQPKPAAPKAEPSIRIAVFGDSLASYLNRGLDEAFADNADVAVIDRSRGDSGLVRRDVVDWPKAADEFLKAGPKPAYAIVMLGANDRQPIREGDQSIEPLSDRWRDIYRDRVGALAKVFADQKVPLIWVGAPPMRSESLTKDLAALNDIFRERVAKVGGTYVDIWPGFVDERNRFVASGPDLEGQPAKLRTSDGVHFTKAGARKVAHFADVELKRLMGAGGPSPSEAQPTAAVAATSGPALDGSLPRLDDTAAIDRQITAMLPSLPEPPGIPALPVKPAAGPVVPLGRPELSPGGTLVSGRPRDGDPSGTIERTLLRGAAPTPQPGRADDFKWPPG